MLPRIFQPVVLILFFANLILAEESVLPSTYFYDSSGLISYQMIKSEDFKPYLSGTNLPLTTGSKTWFVINFDGLEKREDSLFLFTNAYLNGDLFLRLELFSSNAGLLGKWGDWIKPDLLSYPDNRMILKLPPKEQLHGDYLLCLATLTQGNLRPLQVNTLNFSEVQNIPILHKGNYSDLMIITYGVFWGIVILSLLLVGLQYIHYRENAYGCYGIYLIFLSLLYLRSVGNPFNALFTIHGTYGKYLYASETWIQYLTFAFYIYFIYYFINLNQSKSERLKKIFIYCGNFFLILTVVDIPLQVIFGLEFGHELYNYLRLLFFPLPLVLIVALWQKNSSLFIYIILFGTLLVALPSLFTAFTNWGEGVIGYSRKDSFIRIFQFYKSSFFIPMYHTRIGICLEILCFTIALGYKNQWVLKQLQLKSEPKSLPVDPVVSSLQKLILSNLEQEFDLDEICDKLHLSRSKLHDRVKTTTGKSTSIFIRSIRLEEARKLLFGTQMTISEIAYRVGFKDPNYFTRTFTQEFGISPKRMREGK